MLATRPINTAVDRDLGLGCRPVYGDTRMGPRGDVGLTLLSSRSLFSNARSSNTDCCAMSSSSLRRSFFTARRSLLSSPLISANKTSESSVCGSGALGRGEGTLLLLTRLDRWRVGVGSGTTSCAGTMLSSVSIAALIDVLSVGSVTTTFLSERRRCRRLGFGAGIRSTVLSLAFASPSSTFTGSLTSTVTEGADAFTGTVESSVEGLNVNFTRDVLGRFRLSGLTGELRRGSVVVGVEAAIMTVFSCDDRGGCVHTVGEITPN